MKTFKDDESSGYNTSGYNAPASSVPVPASIKLDHAAVQRMNLSELSPHVDSQFLTGDAGREPYRLLAYLSSQLPDGTPIADLGTFQGASALALSFNPEVAVKTYDIVDRRSATLNRSNISFHLRNCLE